MASLQTHAPAPHVHETPPPGKQISPADALKHVQAYLKATRTAAHLHPDALFTEAGIGFTSSASVGGVVLHQLRRVEQGLQGVWLGQDLELEGEGEIGDLNAGIKNGFMAATSANGGNYQEQLRALGEGVIEGELEVRQHGVAEVEGPTSVGRETRGKKRRHDEVDNSATPAKDKEARKKAKAERRKKEKMERLQQRQQAHYEPSNDDRLVDDLEEEEVLINGTIQDETREEFDEAGPSVAYLPDKISSTLTKTPEEVRQLRKEKKKEKKREQLDKEGMDQESRNTATDLEEVIASTTMRQSLEKNKDKKKEKEKKKQDNIGDNEATEVRRNGASNWEEQNTGSALHESSKKKKKRNKSEKKERNANNIERLPTPPTSTAQRATSPPKSATVPTTNGNVHETRLNTLAQQFIVSSSNSSNILSTPNVNAAVVKETPPSKAGSRIHTNGFVPMRDSFSDAQEGESENEGNGKKNEAEAKRKAERKGEKRRKKEEKREKKRKKEEKRRTEEPKMAVEASQVIGGAEEERQRKKKKRKADKGEA